MMSDDKKTITTENSKNLLILKRKRRRKKSGYGFDVWTMSEILLLDAQDQEKEVKTQVSLSCQATK